jgi:hypothetical protein
VAYHVTGIKEVAGEKRQAKTTWILLGNLVGRADIREYVIIETSSHCQRDDPFEGSVPL